MLGAIHLPAQILDLGGAGGEGLVHKLLVGRKRRELGGQASRGSHHLLVGLWHDRSSLHGGSLDRRRRWGGIRVHARGGLLGS